MKEKLFGKIDDKPVYEYTLEKGGLKVGIITYGATIRSLNVTLLDGSVRDVVLGYNSLDEYVANNGCFGATIGRVANRISGAKYTLNGKEYKLVSNENENTLHGGPFGFNTKIWDVIECSENSISLGIFSPNGEGGFNANLSVAVKYTITKNNSLMIEYRALSDDDTPLSLTNHAYFNLNGECAENVMDTELIIDSDKILRVDENLIPNGDFIDVKGSVYDFNTAKVIGDYLNSTDENIKKYRCYDVCYVLNGNGFRKVAGAKSNDKKLQMEVYTDMDAMQLYTENYLLGRMGKSGKYGLASAFCFETQRYVNAINVKSFPSCVLKKCVEYKSQTEYKFII